MKAIKVILGIGMQFFGGGGIITKQITLKNDEFISDLQKLIDKHFTTEQIAKMVKESK